MRVDEASRVFALGVHQIERATAFAARGAGKEADQEQDRCQKTRNP